MFDFLRRVREEDSDPQLNQKLKAELGTLIYKWNVAYRSAVLEYGKSNIWGILPEYFKRSQQRMKAQIDSLQGFLASTDVVKGPQCSTTFREFKLAYNAWTTQNSYKRRRFTQDFYAHVFDENGITLEADGDTLRGVMLATNSDVVDENML